MQKKLVLNRETLRRISGGAFVIDDGGSDLCEGGGGCPSWTSACGTVCNTCSPQSGECNTHGIGYTCDGTPSGCAPCQPSTDSPC